VYKIGEGGGEGVTLHITKICAEKNPMIYLRFICYPRTYICVNDTIKLARN